MSNIILIGFMGAGKTAVGQRLAKELGFSYIDTDDLIEKTAQKNISQIFADEGEVRFRELESEVVKTMADYENFVVATGGGIVLREENVTVLKTIGPLILLRAEPTVIFDRIRNQFHRPLLKVADPLGEINKILAEREPIYKKVADQTIETSGLNISQVVEEIKQWLKSK